MRNMLGTQLFASATPLIRSQILPPSEIKSLYGSTSRSAVSSLSNVSVAISLISRFAQRSFQLDVKIAAHLCHSLIAKLAKEGRWLVIFKNGLAALVFEQNHPERGVKDSREFIAVHL